MAARRDSVDARIDAIGEELADWGKVVLIETVGRASGLPVRTPVGFVDANEDVGTLIVAAGTESSDWVLNLRSHPTCRATVGERVATYEAREIHGADRAEAITRLILKYGTPAERLGRGPVFRLVPVSGADT